MTPRLVRAGGGGSLGPVVMGLDTATFLPKTPHPAFPISLTQQVRIPL